MVAESVQGAGPEKGKTYPGIVKVERDLQTVCFAPPGKQRPTAFESKPGSGNLLQVWKRKPR